MICKKCGFNITKDIQCGCEMTNFTFWVYSIPMLIISYISIIPMGIINSIKRGDRLLEKGDVRKMIRHINSSRKLKNLNHLGEN